MNLADFNFDLPNDLIAQRPARPRNHARLLVYNRVDKSLRDERFYNLEAFLPDMTTLVLNNSKVEKCRLRFGTTELFVLETVNPTTVKALVRPGRKFQPGKLVELGALTVTTTDIAPDGVRTLSLSLPIDDDRLEYARLTPFPPYIAQDENLADEYQTVYATPLGSKAAPTAGLHFTSEQLQQIKQHHALAEVTLHVGFGTFAPVKTDDLANHRLHSEAFSISEIAASGLNKALHRTAVGTTSVRVLESAQLPFQPQTSTTDIFIRPGYEFQAVDSLITNFHLPKSTLLMLVAAFMGSIDEMQRVYKHAIQNQYRFYSFGDAMLIL